MHLEDLQAIANVVMTPEMRAQAAYERFRERERKFFATATPEELEWRRREGIATGVGPPWAELPEIVREIWLRVEGGR